MRQWSRILILPALLLGSLVSNANAEDQVARPPITGIARVRIFTTNIANAQDFYEKTLGLAPSKSGCATELAACLIVNDHQQVQLMAAPSPGPANLISKIALATSDVLQMRRYLISKGLTPDPISIDADHSEHFSIRDPEGHAISFVKLAIPVPADKAPGQTSTALIHAGFIVQNREAEDRFYRDILGFHLYWHGGMKDNETSWVSMQIPNGTDWLEYMVNIPSDADHHTVGVMNHIALGVTNIQAAKQQLLKNGWKLKEEPKMGRDGKWQLNLYDPDDTRVEFMEFKPVEKPCCSEFTGPHPQL